jgi:hypothetical protein
MAILRQRCLFGLALLLLGVMACAGHDSPASAGAQQPSLAGMSPGGSAATSAAAGSSSMAGQDVGLGGTGSDVAGHAGQGGAVAGATTAAGTGAGSPADTSLSVEPGSLSWTAVRHYTGSTPRGRTSGPAQGPSKTLLVHNNGDRALDVTLALSGPDAARFELVTPGPLSLAAGADASVTLQIITDDAALGPAPAQDDGATVLDMALELEAAGQQLSVRSYALVLTYVELEPTFGQILRAFPEWTTKLPSWLPDDANPNPGASLPGVVPGTDEVQGASFEKLDATQPVTLRPLARFSPPGLVPFGWYQPGKPSSRTTVASLAEQPDPHTNDKSRMLEPPLASGSFSFEPGTATFAIWMLPVGVGLLTSEDASCFDEQHRVRAWSLRDAQGTIVPGTFLIGAEEANNGDYQDYVFVLGNVKPASS